MRKGLFGFGFVALFAVGCAAETEEKSPVEVTPSSSSVEPQSFGFKGIKHQLVVFKSDTLPRDHAARIASSGAKLRKSIDALGVATIDADAASATKLAKDPNVLLIGTERVYRMPKTYKKHANKPPPKPQDFLYPAQWDIRRIHADTAQRNVSLDKQAKVTVAVLDVGVMDDHPDLAGQVTLSLDTSYSYRADGAGCARPIPTLPPGYPDYFSRINVDTGNNCEIVNDTGSIQDHGTHVAGTIAGNLSASSDPSTGGIVGVGPGLKIAAYKVFDRFHDSSSPGDLPDGDAVGALDGPILDALADAANRGIPVVNMSLGGHLDRTDPEQEAVYQAWNRAANLATRKGTLIVVAAGNESAVTGKKNDTAVPADLPAVVNVSAAATNKMVGPFDLANGIYGPIDAAPKSDVLAFYSNRGRTVDVSAPGGDFGPNCNYDTGEGCEFQYGILSSIPEYDPAQGLFINWAWFVGTSMASPHVAATAALIKAKHPNWGPLLIRAQLQLTTQSVGSFWNPRFGTGIVDADRATR